jgi:hypothetical protein
MFVGSALSLKMAETVSSLLPRITLCAN